MDQIETPSGKGAGDENFPVGSKLIAPRLRPHVMAFYAFARAIDDIADNPDLDAEDKIRRLDRMEAALTGEIPPDQAEAEGMTTATTLARSLALTGVTARHGCDLIVAFRRDATQRRYRDWEDLMSYCRYSADPVGRYLLDLHGEDPAGYAASDALCSVLQVLNHCQDCAKDYSAMDRVYLPEPWLIEAGGGVEDLAAPAATPAVRAVLDRCLSHCQPLLATARTLAPKLRDKRLAAESETIVRLAHRLAAKLAVGDPVATRIKPSKGDFARAAVGGLWTMLTRRRPPVRSPARAPS